jgi:serine/threonine protein kinase
LKETENRWRAEKKTFTNFNECFEFYFNISFEPLKEKFSFRDNFIQNGTYRKLFSEERKIARGSFGTVFKAKLKQNKSVYVVKRMNSKEENVQDIIKEFEIFSVIKKLDNKFVVRVIDAWLENNYIDGNNRLSMFISMEFCEMSLEDVISEISKDTHLIFKKSDALTPVGYFFASRIFSEILEAVNYLHNQNPPIIHRDLKPANILLSRKIAGSHVRIADFGAMVIHRHNDESHTSDKGSPGYTAPEVVKGKIYDMKADVYSLGIVLEELFSLDIDR